MDAETIGVILLRHAFSEWCRGKWRPRMEYIDNIKKWTRESFGRKQDWQMIRQHGVKKVVQLERLTSELTTPTKVKKRCLLCYLACSNLQSILGIYYSVCSNIKANKAWVPVMYFMNKIPVVCCQCYVTACQNKNFWQANDTTSYQCLDTWNYKTK